MNNELLPFDSFLHEQLFTCFILKANSNEAYEIEKESIELNFGVYSNLCARDYYLPWEDRTIHQERTEFVGYVHEHGFNNYDMILVDRFKHGDEMIKVSVRFEE